MDGLASLANTLGTFGFLLTIVLFFMFAATLLFFLGKIAKSFHLKRGDSEISFTKSGEVSPSEPYRPIMEETSFIPFLKMVIRDSVELGFQKSQIMERMYKEQVDRTRSHLRSLTALIAAECAGSDNIPSTEINLINIVLENVVEDKIFLPLNEIYIPDRLSEKDKDELIEIHSPFIKSATNNIAMSVKQILSNKDYATFLVQIINNKKREIESTIETSLSQAQQSSIISMKHMEEIQENFDKSVQDTMTSYFHRPVSKDTLPATWSSKVPELNL